MTRETRRFLLALATIAVIAFAIRVGFLFLAHHPYHPHGDAAGYHSGANFLADGEGFVTGFYLEDGEPTDSAAHPPLYTIWLSITSFLGFTSPLAHQLWSCLLGMGTILVLGILGRDLVGHRTGLIAAGIAAVYPNIFWFDTVILSETMSILTASLAVLTAYRYWRAPSTGRLVLVGLVCGLAALSRPELALLVPLVLVPLALASREVPWPTRLRRLGAGGLVSLLVVTPWIAYNMSRFEDPVFLSSGLGVTLAATQCDEAYYGRYTGLWSVDCSLDVERTIPEGADESERATEYLSAAFDYLGDNLDRFPVVVLARLGRTLGVYDVVDTVGFDELPEGRDQWIAITGRASLYPMMILTAVGIFVLRRRRIPVYPLVALMAIALLTVAIAFASSRYRSTADPALVLLAAVAIDAGLRRWRKEPAPDESRPALAEP